MLAVVGALYLLAQLVLFDLHRTPSWDEAVYLSQVSPHVPTIFFAPSRARGITLLIAPLAAFGARLAAIRFFLVVVSSVALVLAFAAWIPTIGWGAPAAAFVFGFSWVALFYGSEAMPNLWVALLALAAAGLVIRRIEQRASPAVALLGASTLALAALFRPLDTLPMAAVLVVYAILRRAPRVAALVVLGVAAGWLPWLVEMSVRFGGPGQAIRDAASVGHVHAFGHPGWALRQQLALTGGTTLGPAPHPGVPALGVLWWGGLVVAGVAGLVASRGTPNVRVLAVAAITGVLLAATYIGFEAGLAPRFLLPAYAFLSVPAGVGIARVRGRNRWSLAALGLTVALLAVWTGGQLATARTTGHRAVLDRSRIRLAGLALRRAAAGGPCTFESAIGYPQIEFASGCTGMAIPPEGAQSARVRFLVVPADAPVLPSWRSLEVVHGTSLRIDERSG